MVGAGALTVIIFTACGDKTPPHEDYEITKSGTLINCNGKQFNGGKPTEIQIKGAISNVVIRNCKINGSIRTMGMSRTGEGRRLRVSSQRLGHTARAQEAAPRNVLLERLTITSDRITSVYAGPGTTGLTLRNSTLRGTTRAVAVYLDAESADNHITGNTFDVLGPREQIAVDGSARNTITNNVFLTPLLGGIKLYRNCGEQGTIRHQPPSDNIIQGNTFHSDLRLNQLIIVNARDSEPRRDYCDADKGKPFGSSADDRDNGVGNLVRGNRVAQPTP